MQNKSVVTGPKLPYYIENIFTTLLNNIDILINLVNKVEKCIVNIFSNNNDISNF